MSTPRHIVVAINPQASFGKNAGVGARVIERLERAGYEVTACREQSFEMLHRATEAAIATADALVVVGGDGMVSLGVNLVARTSLPLGIIPSGTGNDLARGIGLPVGDLDACMDHLITALERSPRPIDLAKVTHVHGVRWFACILSAGFDALVNERANRMRFPRGKSRYTWAILAELLKLKPREYALTIDGVTRQERAILISVANNQSMGGGMRVTPDASLTDGLLDVFILKPVSRMRFLRLYPRVFSGTHTGEPEVLIERARSVTVDAQDVVGYADGERIGPLPLTVAVVPSACQLLWPD